MHPPRWVAGILSEVYSSQENIQFNDYFSLWTLVLVTSYTNDRC